MPRATILSAERGDVLLDGLWQIGAYLTVLALLCFELVAVGVNLVQLDELAGDIARETASVIPETRDARVRQIIAEAEVRRAATEHPGVGVGSVTVELGGAVTVTLSRPPRTAVVQHLGPVARRVPQTITASGGRPSM